jgi:outer membrane lipoprotein-sorting protein
VNGFTTPRTKTCPRGPRITRGASSLLMAPALLLSGCFLPTHRKLPIPIAPAVVQTATPQELAKQINQRCDAIHSLSATVEMQASVTKGGVESGYPSIGGIILMRKPKDLRVYGRAPVVGTRILDMVSDGESFKLWIPHENEVIEGPAKESKTKSQNQFENLRPGFFFDALAVRCLAKDDEFYVTADTDTMEDAAKKRLMLEPEYLLNVVHREENSQELAPVRVIHFHRDDLLPYQQDLYDAEGNLETQVYFGRYVDFGDHKYPSTITIKRPLDGLQLVLTIEKVTENLDLKNDSFQLPQIPPDTKLKRLQ